MAGQFNNYDGRRAYWWLVMLTIGFMVSKDKNLSAKYLADIEFSEKDKEDYYKFWFQNVPEDKHFWWAHKGLGN